MAETRLDVLAIGDAIVDVIATGDDAFLAMYHGTTAQVAWMAGGRLATASVTCLAGDEHWAIAAAHAIAAFLDR